VARKDVVPFVPGPPELPPDPDSWSHEDFVAAWLANDNYATWNRAALAAAYESRHGDLKRYAAAVGVAYQTLRNYRSVAKAYAKCPDVGTIPFGVAEALVGHPDRFALVSRPEPWTVAEARELVKARREEARRDPHADLKASLTGEADVSAAHATIDSKAAEDYKAKPVPAAPAEVSGSVTDSLPTTRPVVAQEDHGEPEVRSAAKTIRINPVPGPVPGPVPVACPGCRSRDELVADLQAECVRLKAAHPDVVMAEELKVVTAQRDALRAEVARLSGGSDGAEQEDPGVHPQLAPEAADGGPCAQCTVPGAALAWVLRPDGTKGSAHVCDGCLAVFAGEHPECGYSRAEPPDPPVTTQAELDDIYASFGFSDEVTA
jgi:hypothetical protein